MKLRWGWGWGWRAVWREGSGGLWGSGVAAANGLVKPKQAKETKRKAADEGMVSPHLH